MIRDKEKESEIQKDWLLSDFLTYEQQLKIIYYSIVKFESWLKIKYKPAPVIPDTEKILGSAHNDGVSLTERLDKVSLKLLFYLLS
jgi:hypothetical protein